MRNVARNLVEEIRRVILKKDCATFARLDILESFARKNVTKIVMLVTCVTRSLVIAIAVNQENVVHSVQSHVVKIAEIYHVS